MRLDIGIHDEAYLKFPSGDMLSSYVSWEGYRWMNLWKVSLHENKQSNCAAVKSDSLFQEDDFKKPAPSAETAYQCLVSTRKAVAFK